ncbi:MAG: hypothetical protein JST80_12730 [Bdellovibrionales bacterium]|nr:hypothetical protein [Bdellovibrionales bacterium]
MKVLRVYSVISAVALGMLTSCSQDQSKDLCDQNYIDTYNDVIASKLVVENFYNENGTKNASGMEDARSARVALQTLDTTCDNFLNRYRGMSCKAMSLDNGEAIQTSSAQIESNCNTARTLLASDNGVQTALVDGNAPATALYDKNIANAELHELPPTQRNVEVVTADELDQK